MKIRITIFCILIVVLGIGYYYSNKVDQSVTQDPMATNAVVQKDVNTSLPTTTSTALDNQKSIPDTYKIANVPFATQAPLGNWDALHEEACEEASLAIVDYYFSDKVLTPQLMENEIQKMVSWEGANWGKSDKDLTAAEEKTLAQNIYSLNPEVKTIASLDDIKQEIAQNHIVIVPAAGRSLDNPNFTAPGPVYHMLVITGYTSTQIITNDVGTRNGKDFAYDNDNIWNAIHDWLGSASNIENGQKVMLVF